MVKGLILSGGSGTRLRPLTYTGAKQLLPICNKPILFYAIEAMCDAGIDDIGIIVGDTASEVKQAVGDGTAFGVRVAYIPQEKPLGLAHAVKIAEPFLGDSSFLMFLGDNLIRDGVTALVDKFRKRSSDALILVSEVSEPEHFGVVELENGRVVHLIEKPKVSSSNLALVGVYGFRPAIFKAVHAIEPSARGELEITDAIQWMVDEGFVVEHDIVSGWWKDTGRPSDILDANRLMLDTIEPQIHGEVDECSQIFGRVRIGTRSRIINSTLRGPIVIGEGVHIQNSYIGPYTSISNHVTVKSTEIENSIVLEESWIQSKRRIDQSLIGKFVKIVNSEMKPKAMRLVLGDHSRCEV